MTDSNLPTVRLFLAFMWDCQDCGIENFCRSVRAELTPEEAHADAIKLGLIEPWEVALEGTEGRMVTVPEIVDCKDCNARFRTIDDLSEEQP